MSVKYYNKQWVKSNELHGTLERVCRFTGFIGFPQNGIYGYNMSTNSIEIFQGDSRVLKIFVRDQDMNVVNLNGATAKLYIAETSKSTQYLIRKTTADFNQGAITDPVNGEVSLYLKSTDTSSLAGQYFYLVQVYLSTGDKYTVLKGLINVSTDVGVSPLPPPDPSSGVNIVDLDIGVSSYTVLFDAPSLIIGASLVAPSALSENNFVTNITYTGDTATIYFSTAIQEAGWKLSYLIVTT
jgi:hypothetical protein